MKNLTAAIAVTLPGGDTIPLFTHTMPLNPLEALGVAALLAQTGGKLTVEAEATLSEL